MLIKAFVLALFSVGFLSIGFYNYYVSQQYSVSSPLPQASLKTPQVLAAQTEPSPTISTGLTLLNGEQMQYDAIEMFKEPSPTPTVTPTLTPTPIPSTPTPSPAPPPVVAPADLDPLFSKYSSEYGVDKELLKRIAQCESHMNSGAVNGDYGGMYQFATQSWISTRGAMGQNTDPSLRFNAEESIKTSAYKISKGGIGAWPNCNR